MKSLIITSLLASALVVTGCGQESQKSEATEETAAPGATSGAPALESLEQRISYVFGYNIGQQLKRDNIEVDVDVLTQAIREAVDGKDARLSAEETELAMKTFQEQQQAKREEAVKVVADANKKEGEAFLATNKEKEGVVTTASGLQYKVITPGTGPSPKASDKVSVHYRGTLIDGTEFDSSYRRGQPVSFQVEGVIAGWTEALQLMKEGAKWELYIPSDLAYGSGGTGGQIGPNATLIFEVELLEASSAEG
ncbi:FKBP-type peptidyl-prolyl cis-trans isomerase [Exilibacterium tricleocarpae]|uniref:Peptidyl-prolyl cis-trans isomerase n=1 Tax=Exilibacterium tricleocarpae TaxID=2591008 RepID=A0A545TZ74_9GAMM|nr:FKBP-type peptidyl-prolyl cis-trans isomerase [Exilibacterium tricleocarpae]TQV82522.1 FKBP-type peptidyl-prolyl cis-trans isomerase [Exilibacterium tricleocarpae]